jgi:hypothetical protein
MRMLKRLIETVILGVGIAIVPSLDAVPSTIHYRTSHQQFDDCLDDEERCDDAEEEEHKRWYHSHRYRDAYDDGEDPAEELEHDTSWPGKRDDSWDQLFR